MDTTKITIQSTVSADKSKAWNYYTMPEHITQWNFATDDWECPKVENDMQVGRKYYARMEAKDGSVGFDFEAIYDDIDEGESFTYTMLDNRQVDVNFESIGDETLVTITFDAEKENSEELQRSGWQAILDNFKRYVEAN
ncbi:SRPBCC domain-containing protein [Pedobacter sp.]|uniref:SRPBCC domain-containing protein n=1 Tax=Pedobacter sp. TaxID=1411316 RepID=UPI003D7F95CA